MRAERTRKELESLAEGIREELDNATRSHALPDHMAALERIAALCKRLRSLCNRELMELQRLKDGIPKRTNPSQQ
ncbi:MAG TPA: hypothetical protein PLB89_17650 [Flavobacteriales bacterium]|nr:hypothetical protein [Flavobacteriales bacterium]